MWQCVKCPILITVLLYAPGPQQHVLNMAASNEGIAGALNIIEDMIARLNSLNDPDCIEGFAIRLEVLKRHLINIEINATALELVESVCRRFDTVLLSVNYSTFFCCSSKSTYWTSWKSLHMTFTRVS